MIESGKVYRCTVCRRLIVSYFTRAGVGPLCKDRHLHRAWLAEDGDWPSVSGSQLTFCFAELVEVHDRPDVLAAWLLGNDRAVDLINVAERAQELAAC